MKRCSYCHRALIDMLALPVIIGVIAGLLLVGTDVKEPTRSQILNSLNFFYYLIFNRDFIYSPGRHLFGIELVDARTKVRICFYRGNLFLNLWKSFLRNALLVVPFVLVLGYLVEIIAVIWKGHRIADKWAGVEVIEKSRSSEKLNGR